MKISFKKLKKYIYNKFETTKNVQSSESCAHKEDAAYEYVLPASVKNANKILQQ